MPQRTAQCSQHGLQSFGFVCIHVGLAIDTQEQVGFFWGEDDPEMGRPFAWCAHCQRFLIQHGGDFEALGQVADFKLI